MAPRWRKQEDPERKTRYLYWWLLVALIFEYARPGAHFPALQALPFYSVIPLSLFVLTWFVPGLRPWRDIVRDPMTKWLVVFIVFMLGSMLWADNKTRTLDNFERSLGYFFLFLMIVRIVTTEQRVRGVFVTLICCHLFLLIMSPQVVLDPSVRHYIRGAPFLGDGNDYSLSVCLLVPFAIHVSLTAKTRFRQILGWSVCLVLILAIVGTQSRGATLGVAAVFGYLWLQSSRKGLTLAAIGVAALIAIMFAPAVYFERMSTIVEYQQESSAMSRIEAWKAGTRMALDNPLGVGSGNFPNNFPKYRGPNAPVRWMTAHSMYFLVLGELGFLGLLLLFRLVLGNLWIHGRMRRALQQKTDLPEATAHSRTLYMMSAGFVGLAVAGAFLSVTYYPHIFVLNGLAIAYRAIVVEKTGVALVVNKPGPKERRLAAIARQSRAQGKTT
jgi:putative inorganic carbon (HCO3(-)) transporter